MDDADAELQDRIDRRSAKIIIRAARRLRGIHFYDYEADTEIKRRILIWMTEILQGVYFWRLEACYEHYSCKTYFMIVLWYSISLSIFLELQLSPTFFKSREKKLMNLAIHLVGALFFSKGCLAGRRWFAAKGWNDVVTLKIWGTTKDHRVGKSFCESYESETCWTS